MMWVYCLTYVNFIINFIFDYINAFLHYITSLLLSEIIDEKTSHGIAIPVSHDRGFRFPR